MGLAKPIVPAGHFPRVEDTAATTVEELDLRETWTINHSSFNDAHDLVRSPAWDLLEEQVNSGDALLFEDIATAEAYVGGKCHPAPLGNVSKLKEDGTWKHRLIQDLRANGVNAAVEIPERQVLPRGVDHGIDMAALAAELPEGMRVYTLVLDFANAFMSVPLHAAEQRFNCATAGFEVVRSRRALYDGETSRGRFVVWRTLGFGGRPKSSRLLAFWPRLHAARLKL